jgi:tetratricopeptide (TPR) repeat protein
VVVLAAGGSGGFLFWKGQQNQKEVDRLLQEALETHSLLDDSSQAMLLLQKAVKLDPDRWEPHYYLGNTSLALNKIGDAIGHFEEALRRAPQQASPAIHLQVGQAYFRRHEGTGKERDFRLARASFQKSITGPEQRADGLFHLAMLYSGKDDRIKEDLVKALDYFDQLLKEYPDYPEPVARELSKHLRQALQ